MSKLYYNGNIITMEEEGQQVEALLEKDGIIFKTGSLESVKSFTDANTEEVDLQGKTLMPSFIDPHGHVSMVGQMSSACNLSQCETFESLVSALKDYLANSDITEEGLIFGYAYDHNFLPDEKHPTKEFLDQVSTTIPLVALHTSAHMACVNSKMLELAGITAETENPQGGLIGRVGDSTEPNGYLEENAMFAAMGLMKTRIKFDPVVAIKSAQLEYLKNGITTVQDGATDEATFGMLKHLAENKLLDIDMVCYPIIKETTEEFFTENKIFDETYSNRLKLGGYKVVLDGSPQGKSAWMTKPYENSDGYCAYSWFPDEKVEEFMSFALKNNKQVLVHCNGDAAGDQFLTSYVNAYEKSENPNKKNLRPVMIHCQTARDDQLDIMAKYDMIPSIFVGHVYFWGDVHVKNLGKERGERVSPVQSAFNRGLVVNFHQDPPVTLPNALHSLWTAVNRKTRGGNVIGKEQICSVYDGLKAITINGAYSYFEEDKKGTLKEGKLADLVILDQNPMKIGKEKIKDIQVLETIKEGVTLFKK